MTRKVLELKAHGALIISSATISNITLLGVFVLARQVGHVRKAKGLEEAPMSVANDVLLVEAERLIARAERTLRRHQSGAALSEAARHAELQLKRLRLYRAVLKSSNAAHAIMPEFAIARGLLPTDQSD
jgi:hypothetical protein